MRTIRHDDLCEEVQVAKLLTGFAADEEPERFTADFVAFICAFQGAHDLDPDGVIGPKTWAAIAQGAPTCSTAKNKTSAATRAAQILLDTDEHAVSVDGIFGSKTKAAVTAFQSGAGLTADGICGVNTWTAMLTDTVPVERVKPSDMKQYDSRWKNCVYTSCGNSSQTIGNSGCGTTCAANVIATWWDSAITPKETSKEAVQQGYRTRNSGTDPGYFRFIANRYGASKYGAVSGFAAAKAYVDAGGLVIVNVGPSVWTKGGHYILLYKVDGDTVYICDPASSASNRAKNTVSALKAAAKGYYCFMK